MQTDLDHMRFYGEERVTWKGAAVAWAEQAPRSIRPGTLERYRFSLKNARPILDHLYLDEIGPKTIAKIAKRTGVTNATLRRDITAVSSVLRHAVAEGWIDSNPAALWDRSVIRETRDPIVPPDDADIERLARHCPATFGDSIRFLRETGMRQGEAISLEWPQIDLRHSEAALLQTKSNRPRVVPLNEQALIILGRQPRHISRHTVFHTDGRPFKNYASRFAGYARTVGTTFRCHDLRHKFAIVWLREHGDIYRLSRILGHASVKTTEIYLGYVDLDPAQKPAQRRWSQGNGEGDG
jgi:integrase/recombinase XerD